MAVDRQKLSDEGKEFGINIDEEPASYVSWLRTCLNRQGEMDSEKGMRILCGVNVYLRANDSFHLPNDVRSGLERLQSRMYTAGNGK